MELLFVDTGPLEFPTLVVVLWSMEWWIACGSSPDLVRRLDGWAIGNRWDQQVLTIAYLLWMPLKSTLPSIIHAHMNMKFHLQTLGEPLNWQ